MKEYLKIETLYDRDDRFKVVIGKWRLPEFEYLAANEWVWTEKVDGTNIRVLWDGSQVTFGGKTDNAQMPTFLLRKLMETFTAEKLASVFPSPACLYGEGYGAKIQKGGGNYKPDGVDFVLFDGLVDSRWWLERANLEDIARRLDIGIVPIIGRGNLEEATRLVRSEFSSYWGNFPAEGLVLKPAVDLFSRKGERIVAKLKAKDF